MNKLNKLEVVRVAETYAADTLGVKAEAIGVLLRMGEALVLMQDMNDDDNRWTMLVTRNVGGVEKFIVDEDDLDEDDFRRNARK
jgi:hypothetical protein